MVSNYEVEKAIKVLQEALITDESYRLAWISNIAVNFKDEAQRQQSADNWEKQHTISNKAAKNFIRILCYKDE